MKYQVLVTRDATEHAFVIVEAPDVASAESRAIVMARADRNGALSWHLDEGNSPPECYIADPGNCAEVMP